MYTLPGFSSHRVLEFANLRYIILQYLFEMRQKFALITKCAHPAMWTECFYIELALSERLYYIHSKQLIFCDSM